MKRLEFTDIEDFSCELADKIDELIEENEFNDISVVAKYEEARKIIRELLCIGYQLKYIELEPSDRSGYNKEYIISLINLNNENEYEIWCEPMKTENGYLDDSSTVIYVMDNCSSEVLKHLDSKFTFEVGIGEEECNCEDCCECACKKDEKPTTTPTTSKSAKSIYKVNGKECNKETYVNALRTIEDMYTKNISETLSGYSDFVDEMHKWKRLLGW